MQLRSLTGAGALAACAFGACDPTPSAHDDDDGGAVDVGPAPGAAPPASGISAGSAVVDEPSPRGPASAGVDRDAAPSPVTAPADAAVQFIGRFEETDPAGPKASWPGSRIVARFSGTSVSATLREFAWDWMDGAPSYWEVSIDRVPTGVLAMVADDTPRVFALASDLPPGDHEVELYKRSEMQTGVTQFLGFDFHGGTLLAPPPRRKRHIEAMADSYGTGYGIEVLDAPDHECGVNHAGKFQNFRKAWPEVLAERFDAEIEGTVYSGKGLTRGIWPTDDDGLIDYYGRSNPDPARQKRAPLFDLQSWVPDVIVLVQGTVDNGLSDFRTVYRDFVVQKLRARAPEAYIFLVVPGQVARAKWIDVVNSVARERNDAGDLRVYPVIPGGEQPAEMTGCGNHGDPAYHRRIAAEIGDVIAEKVGW